MQQRSIEVSDEELIKSYNELKHLGKLAERYKLPHIQVWRRCQQLGLKFKNKGSSPKIPLSEILEGKHGYYPTGKLKKRLIAEEVLEYKCSECGLTEWNGKKIVLQLDHKNGVSTDHRLENLRFMCPNCHSQTDTWCGKNIGKYK